MSDASAPRVSPSPSVERRRNHPIIVAEWDSGERQAFVKAFFTGSQSKGAHLDNLKRELSARYGGRPALLFNRARFGIDLALRRFCERQPDRNEVIFPGYICPSVPEAIERCGLKPIAADVRDDLNIDPAEISRRLNARTLAVIAAHMYGCPAPIADIEALCRDAGVFLIDDAAQVAGVTVDGRLFGTFGDCGLLSFSQSKTIVAGDRNAGGVLLVNNPDFEAPFERSWAELPDGRFRLRDTPWFFLDGALNANRASFAYYASAVRRRLTGIEPAPMPVVACKMANLSAGIALRQIASLSQRVAGRTRVVAEFAARLVGDGRIGMPQFAAGRYLTRVLIRPPDSVDIAAYRARLGQAGIATRAAYPPIAARIGRVPRATEYAARLVEIPSHSRMDPGIIVEICAAAVRAL